MSEEQKQLSLEDFVRESLCSIVAGAVGAQERIMKMHGYVNPFVHSVQKDKAYISNYDLGNIPIEDVEFDVAVTYARSDENKMGVGIFAALGGAGAQHQDERANHTISRLRFSIPIQFPIPPKPNKSSDAK